MGRVQGRVQDRECDRADGVGRVGRRRLARSSASGEYSTMIPVLLKVQGLDRAHRLAVQRSDRAHRLDRACLADRVDRMG